MKNNKHAQLLLICLQRVGIKVTSYYKISFVVRQGFQCKA